MGKLIIGTGMFMVGVFLCFTVIGAIPGTVLIFTGGGMMWVGFASLTVSTVKGGMAAGKVIREMNKEKNNPADPPMALSSASNSPSVAEEIRKLGELLSAGLLTQEEFDRKKAQLLA